LLVAAVLLAMLVGLLGAVVPMMPGLVVIWGAGLVYGLIDGFGRLGTVVFAVMTVLLLVGAAASYVLPHRAGTRAGASKASIRLGILLAVVGFFVIPVIGLIVGGVAGVYLGERQRLGDGAAAWRATKQVLLGFGAGMLVEVLAGILMILAWLVWAVAV
jgi:uncharacterized protein